MARRKFKGILITFEGTEGAGKSTLIREVAKQLTEHGFRKDQIIVTREPGGSPVAEKIRTLILAEAMTPRTELLLYEAARAEHLARTVLPGLQAGKIVLCDRFTDSSLAYQAHARGLPWAEVKILNDFATQKIRPNLTVLLDIDPALGLKRAREHTRFEAEGVRFQTRVRKGFLKARAEEPRRWITLPASKGTPEALGQRVIEELSRRIGRKRG